MIVAALFLVVILLLLLERVQVKLQARMKGRLSIFGAAAGLAAIFCAAAGWYGVLGWQFPAMVICYAFVPVSLVAFRPRWSAPAGAFDLAAILALWLPLEFALGAALVPRPVQGTLHAIGYGVAVTLALLLFLVHRGLPGMKYRVPESTRDLRNAGLGFLCAAVLLIPLGFAVGFLETAHLPAMSVAAAALRVALIFAGTALPEEILFRSLIQNCLIQRLGASNTTIAIAAVIFGLSHLNNAPGPPPNWSYAIVATVAGFIFGKVFQRSSSVIASALVHTGVNTVKHFFF